MRHIRFRVSRANAIMTGTVEGNPPDRVRTDVSNLEFALANVTLLSPTVPSAFRVFDSFEGHVKTGWQQRGLEVPSQWAESPTFYYSNPNSLYPHGADVPYPAYTKSLDFGLEIGCVIAVAGRDISIENAYGHIMGYTILNNWTARDVERNELAIGLGPAKAKDFATSIGPWIVTPDELADKSIGEGSTLRYDLTMVARINGKVLSSGNLKDIHFTFAEMIARASQGCELRRGDLISSGIVDGGCLLDLGIDDSLGRWLQIDDVVELEVERLGTLRNKIVTVS